MYITFAQLIFTLVSSIITVTILYNTMLIVFYLAYIEYMLLIKLTHCFNVLLLAALQESVLI